MSKDRRSRDIEVSPPPLSKITTSVRRAALLALALSSLADRTFAGEIAPPSVAALELVGVERVSRKALAAALVTQAPNRLPWSDPVLFDSAALDDDMQRVHDYYRERGYFAANASYGLTWDEAGSRVHIRIAVDEGDPVILESVEIEQAREPRIQAEPWRSIRDGLPLSVGKPFGVAQYRSAKRELLRRLAETGHPEPTLEGGAEIDVVERAARVSWRVDAGPRVRFGASETQGLERVAEHIVRREIRFAAGDVYSLSAQRESQENLLELGLFHSVAIEPVARQIPGEESPPAAGEAREEAVWPMRIRLEERPPRTLRVGVGFGTEELFRAHVTWRHRNFLGEARQLDLRAEYNSLTTGLDARLAQPHFLHPRQQIEVDGLIHYETPPAYDALRGAVGTTLFRKFGKSWRLRGGYGFELADVFESREDGAEAEGQSRVGAIKLGLRRRSVDDRLEPTRGAYLDLSLDSALRALGSTANFLTLRGETRHYLPLWWSAVLALRLELGVTQPVAGSANEDVPVYKRFYSGGSTSVRGFKFQELGPLDPQGDPLGGLSLAESSVELRFPIWRRLRGVAFFDAGLVDLRPFRFPLDEIQTAAGPGLRLTTPIGSVRLDVGFPIDRREYEDLFRIHLSVGHAF